MPNTYTGQIEQLDAYRWRLPKTDCMKADGIVYADEALFSDIRNDASLAQVANVACLPGIVGPSMAMPDCHYGYGFPIGGVAAFDAETGVISPGGVGYDINCGVQGAARGADGAMLCVPGDEAAAVLGVAGGAADVAHVGAGSTFPGRRLG